MRLTSLHDSYGSWHLYICRFLFGLSTFLLLHSCLWRALHAVLWRGIFSRAGPLYCAIAKLEVNGLHSFRCYRHVALQSLTTSVICHVFMHCLGPFLMQDMSPRICFSRDKIWNLPWTCCLLTSYIVTPSPAVWLKPHASTVCRFLSRISYLSSYIFLRRSRSLTSRKLYVCLETFLCCLHISDRTEQ